MNVLHSVFMAQASTGMLPNGRAAGTQADHDREQAKARIQEIKTGDDINPEARDKTVSLILKATKEASGWTRDLFNLIRMCGAMDIAKGSIAAGEERALQKVRELIAQEDPNYKGKIRNLNDVARYNGDKQLVYSVTKAKIFMILDQKDELASGLQEWWLFQAKWDGEPHKALPSGYLDIFSKRYADEKKGSTLFMRDVRESQLGIEMLAARKAQKEKELTKQAAADTGKNGDQTQQGIASGVNVDQKGLRVKSTQDIMNRLITLVMDCDNNDDIPTEAINGVLSNAVVSLQKLVTLATDAHKANVSAAGSRPSVDKASESSEDADSVSEETVHSEGEGFVKPEWVAQDQWAIMTEQERNRVIEDGKEAYEEEAHMIEQANEQDDAGSNEPKGEEAVKAVAG